MKCIPITLSGRLVDDAISSIDMLDVLVASMAVSLHIRSSSENAEIFSFRTSGMASMTRSAPDADSLFTGGN